jgi:hypothetical protein
VMLPEFDRFGVFAWNEALSRVGKSLALLLSSIPPDKLIGTIGGGSRASD